MIQSDISAFLAKTSFWKELKIFKGKFVPENLYFCKRKVVENIFNVKSERVAEQSASAQSCNWMSVSGRHMNNTWQLESISKVILMQDFENWPGPQESEHNRVGRCFSLLKLRHLRLQLN